MQDIEIGNPEFDKKFIIKTNNEFKAKSLFNKKKIPEKILNHKGMWEYKLPEKELEISFFLEREIIDIEKLKSLYNLFVNLVNHIYKIKLIETKSA